MATAGLPPVVSQLLVARGMRTAAQAAAYLDTKLTSLRDPQLLPGVPEATARLIAAITAKEPIVIYGDYDADGMTAAAILVNTLRLLGAEVSYHVPNRLDEGYGLNEDALRMLARRDKKVVVTVDCGIASIECAKLCRELGLSLIITDHHRLGETIPDAEVVVHPRLPGTNYPFGELCGAGVAFKLAWSLCQSAAGSEKVTPPMRRLLMQSLTLAAIGTVADVVPLVDENRVLVTHGLRTLAADPSDGLIELMTKAGVDMTATMDSETIGFAIAPRLNAAGRLGQAQLAIELLTIDAGERAVSLADYINGLNGTRETLQRSVQLAASKQLKEQYDADADPAFVLAGVGWHAGVIGIVAGRIAEQHGKPTFILSLDTTGKADAVGSGRAGGSGVDLYAALQQCDHRLVRFGGHHAAAGVTIRESEIDAFRGDFCEAVTTQTNRSDPATALRVDAEAPLGQMNLATLKQIETMGPFGAGNPRPVLMARDVEIGEPARTMGGGDRHLTVKIKQGPTELRAVAFGRADWVDALNAAGGPIEVVYKPKINEYRGMKRVEVELVDWRLPETP